MQQNSQIILLQTIYGQTKIDDCLELDMVWVPQLQMAELFGKEHSTTNERISNIFIEGELPEVKMCRKLRHGTQ